MRKISVSAEPLYQILSALIGPSHHAMELAVTSSLPGNPIATLVEEFNQAIQQGDYVDIDFQSQVSPWMQQCFGPEISSDTKERNHRFLEESLELVQSSGCTQAEAHMLVDYVFNRPVGELKQEVGGVMVTLAALCLARQVNMHECGDTELARIWTKIEQIRAKQAAKPRNSPLPEFTKPE